MTAITIDTYALITTLKDAGIPEQQAKAQIDAMAKFAEVAREQIEHDHKLDDTASKRDLKELELTLSAKLRESELKLEAKISESKAELVRWVIGAGFMQVALITGLILKLSDKI
ncbi:MAG: DUF1640 domain-containing protein [Methylococcales bacterium]|nr:DUF1640 domain-containing protein [Methylococcales bacterium]